MCEVKKEDPNGSSVVVVAPRCSGYYFSINPIIPTTIDNAMIAWKVTTVSNAASLNKEADAIPINDNPSMITLDC